MAALALLAGLSLSMPAALAAKGQMRGTETTQGFGRIVLQFDDAPRTAAMVANGVLVVSFDKSATVSTEAILKEMPGYLTVVRADPDGKGLRFALTRPFRVNVTEAGERVFIDLLPENWRGLPPSLPQEVLEELTQRVRTAEARAKELQRARERAEPKPIAVRSARLPSLNRLIFEVPSLLPIGYKVDGSRIDISFDDAVSIEPDRIRSNLPQGARLVRHEQQGGTLGLGLEVPEGWTIRAFREDDGFIVDMALPRTKGSPENAEQAIEATGAAIKDAIAAAAPAPPVARTRPVPTPAPEAKPAVKSEVVPDAPVASAGKVAIRASSENGGRLDLGFTRPTAMAGIEQDGRIYLVADTADEFEPGSLNEAMTALGMAGEAVRHGRAVVVRIDLPEAKAGRLSAQGNGWSLTLGERGPAAAQPVLPKRAIDDDGQTIIRAAIKGATGVHWIDLDGSGFQIAVITAQGPAQAVTKPFRFVDFDLPPSMSGMFVRPRADDLVVRHGVADVTIGRQGGLSLSPDASKIETAANDDGKTRPLIQRQPWMQARQGSVRERAREQMRKMADLSRTEKSPARMALAETLLANGLAIEALGPLQAAMIDDPSMRNDKRAMLLTAIANALMERDKDATAALDHLSLREDAEAGLWRALIDFRAGRFARAHGGFKRASEILDTYPDHLQGLFGRAAARTAIEQKDIVTAQREIKRLTDLGSDVVPRERVQLLRALADEMIGRFDQAMSGYRELFDEASRPVSAEAQLRGAMLALRENHAAMAAEEAISRLETVGMIWRGGEIEAQVLGELGRIYGEAGRWREAFQTAKNANAFFPDHPITRQLHDRTAQMFEELFITGKGDKLPRLDTLALFYDFKQFMPIGRRGDEVIRRLADRLVQLDLLDQAADLLQHQVDNRLTGAAKATVAARLAMIRLMNRKPSEALATLASSRLPELSADVRRARLLLEAKALSDLSRTDVALEILNSEKGPEIERLRADIFWQGRRWREAGEMHERILGDAWKGRQPLSDVERLDTMRAAIAYVMAEEPLSLDRLRTKFAQKMAESPDARTFAFVTGLDRQRPADLRELARSVAGADTVSEFMKEYRKRYPDYASSLRQKQQEQEAKPPAPAPGSNAAAPQPAPQPANQPG